MRTAEVQRVLDRLRARHIAAAPEFTRLSITNFPGLADFEREGRGGCMTICGGTGTGKSALLSALHTALSARLEGAVPSNLDRLGATRVIWDIGQPDGQFRTDLVVSTPAPADTLGYEKGALLILLPERTYDLQDFFFKVDVNEVVQEDAFIEFDEDLRKFLSFVCKKPYSQIKVWEIESAGDAVVPYFTVSADGVEYSSPDMSTGELSSFYIAWALRSANPYGIILIDEPEAFLPPSGHEAVYAMIAHYAVAKRLGVVISTHSASIAGLAPEESLLSIRRNGTTSELIQGRSVGGTLAELGLSPDRHCILYVEDALIRDVVRDVIARHDLHTVCKFDIVITPNGESGVRAALEHSPSDLRDVRFGGVLDGDMKATASLWSCASRLAFLPFRSAPEAEMLTFAAQKPRRAATALARTTIQVQQALADSAGLDHHEAFIRVAQRLGYNGPEFTRLAWNLWARSAARTKSQTLARRIARLAGVTPP